MGREGHTGCLRAGQLSTFPLVPSTFYHPGRVPSKSLLQTTQDFAFMSPRYGLENQKELKLPLLLFSQGGHGLNWEQLPRTMNTLALSTKAPHLEAVRFQGRHSPPGPGPKNPNLTDGQKINPQCPGSLVNPNPTSFERFLPIQSLCARSGAKS